MVNYKWLYLLNVCEASVHLDIDAKRQHGHAK